MIILFVLLLLRFFKGMLSYKTVSVLEMRRRKKHHQHLAIWEVLENYILREFSPHRIRIDSPNIKPSSLGQFSQKVLKEKSSHYCNFYDSNFLKNFLNVKFSLPVQF